MVENIIENEIIEEVEETPKRKKPPIDRDKVIRQSKISSIKIKITQLKAKLDSLDYKTSKWVEGDLSEQEWEETKAIKKQYRAEINALEGKLKNI